MFEYSTVIMASHASESSASDNGKKLWTGKLKDWLDKTFCFCSFFRGEQKKGKSMLV